MPEPNFQNRTLYHGDNLDFLRGINSGTINLIATDPPFNKNRDFHATPDSLADGASFQDRWSWIDDVHDDWLEKISNDYPEVWSVVLYAKGAHSDGMGAFLCWLGVRLLEMHRVLRDDGSIWLHCDPTASHYIKAIMDAIFGPKNFQNEIIWSYPPGGRGPKYAFHRKHDILLYYSAGPAPTFHRQYRPLTEKQIKKFSKVDKDGRKYKEYRRKTRTYLDQVPGSPVPSVWTDVHSLGQTISKEKTGYPTQKPIALYERIIEASSNEGDFVLDPFCGCATTLIAAEGAGRQWVGIDIWDKAHEVVLSRLQQTGLAVPDHEIGDQKQLISFGDIRYSRTPPVRTDRGHTAVVTLPTPKKRAKKQYPRPRTQHPKLLADVGAYCQGCGNNYGFDPRVLEVDHIRPKSDGGSDAYDNLTLLCPPCNREKADRYTLSHLQERNRKNGFLKPENEGNISHGKASKRKRKGKRRR